VLRYNISLTARLAWQLFEVEGESEELQGGHVQNMA
jgi:hypothetical protein